MKLKRLLLYGVHRAIIVNAPTAARPAAGPRRSGPERASDTANFVIEIAYAGYVVFAVLAPLGHSALFEKALEIPHELMVTRRLYAIEFWLAMAGLAVYLALTEIGPRLRRERADRSQANCAKSHTRSELRVIPHTAAHQRPIAPG